ncbi:MAG: trypsin-like peptidase domain-containing protein [Phycisphaerales bacterium]|nr:trypsin-like peptidase domain-containing protein [Phycisphaerales bacterium]
MRNAQSKLSIALLSIVGLAAGISSPAQANLNDQGVELSEPDSTQRHAMDMAFNISDAFEYAAEKIEPSVVHITVRNTATNERDNRRAGEGLGSGVIVDPRGYILTNNHVIETGRFITVRLADGRELGARLVGTFEETDIAVLKIEAEDIQAAQFGDSEAVRVGQWVLAVGSPFGFEQTVTAGIVSAKGRGSMSPQFAAANGPGSMARLQEFIQTDAAINPGNSGGPLVDLHGNIVGINTAIITRTGQNNGLGFAIPSDIAKAVMEQIIDIGRVERGYLGINMKPLPPFEAHELGIDGGVLIQRIVEDGPAQRAGLRPDDIIVTLGGRSTESVVRLSNAIMLIKPDEPVHIEFLRDGKKMMTSAIVTDRDEEIYVTKPGMHVEELGAKLSPSVLTRYRGRRPVGTLPGFVVVGIEPNSETEDIGFESNDFIYQIDGRTFETAKDIETYIRDVGQYEPIRVQFYRGNKPMFIVLKADSNSDD